MANTRISMRRIKKVLRLHYACALSNKRIAKSLGISASTVHEYLTRFKESKLGWPLGESITEDELERKLFPSPQSQRTGAIPQPDWAEVHKDLKKKGVTLALLWQEYKADHPNGYQYSQFCEHYRRFAKVLSVTMRQVHKAGERLFVDYCGPTVPVTDPDTGEVRQAQVFVAVLGASSYTYAEATWTQTVPDWVGAHVRCFAFLGGVPAIVVPDNLKSAVSHAHRYEPDLNPTYQEMAAHYGTAIVPARVRKPRDKAKVEQGVQLVERWILAVLRKQRFFGLTELNAAIRELLTRLNTRPFRQLEGTRRSQFELLDKPALMLLPKIPYRIAEWRKARVGLDYHVMVDGHSYSVPFALARKEVEVRLTPSTLEVFFKGERVASHARADRRGGATTLLAHMPEAHRRYAGMTQEGLLERAASIGAETRALVSAIFEERALPVHACRTCQGILRLAEQMGAERLEGACARANALGTRTYASIRSILAHALESVPLPSSSPTAPFTFVHDNIRGAGYYTKEMIVAHPSDH